MGKDPDQIRREIEDTRDRMGDTVDALAYKADVPNRVKDSISDRVDSVKSAVANTASRVGAAVTGTTSRLGDSVSGTAGAVGDRLPDAGEVRYGATRAVSMLKENPLGLLVSGIAVGFLIGSLLPHTQLEDERFGELADNLKDQAQAAGSSALEHGKAVMNDTLAAAQSSAQQHGQALAHETQDAVSQTVPATGYSTETGYTSQY